MAVGVASRGVALAVETQECAGAELRSSDGSEWAHGVGRRRRCCPSAKHPVELLDAFGHGAFMSQAARDASDLVAVSIRRRHRRRLEGGGSRASDDKSGGGP